MTSLTTSLTDGGGSDQLAEDAERADVRDDEGEIGAPEELALIGDEFSDVLDP